jgi:hypothetical protein
METALFCDISVVYDSIVHKYLQRYVPVPPASEVWRDLDSLTNQIAD